MLVGLIFGWVGYRAMGSMDEYTLEVLITLAIVMGGYALCSSLHHVRAAGHGGGGAC